MRGALAPALASALGLWLAAIAAAPAAGACRFDTVAEIRLPPVPGPLVVSAALDGSPVRLVLDSGAERSLLSDVTVARLGLRLDPWTASGLRGIGGETRHRDAQVGTLRIGTLELRRPLGPIRSLPVVPALPGNRIDGLLGADLMADLDIEVTGGGLRVALHRAAGCDAATARAALGWATATLPSEAVRPGLFVVPVTVAGRTLRALIDTGSEITVLDDRAAAALGLHVSAPAGAGQGAGQGALRGTARGVGPAAVTLQLAEAGPLTVATDDGGALALGAGPVWVGRLPATGFDLLVGTDRLRALHLWLSHAARAVFLARLSHTR